MTYTIKFRRGRKTKTKKCVARDFFAAALLAVAIKPNRYRITSVKQKIKRKKRHTAKGRVVKVTRIHHNRVTRTDVLPGGVFLNPIPTRTQ